MADVVFDACAFIALLRNEPGADVVETILTDCRRGMHRGFVHALNLYEVERKIRVADPDRADVILKLLRQVLREHCITVGRSVSLRMQKCMVMLKMAAEADFAALDAACVGYATTTHAYVLTADHNEMRPLEASDLARFLLFR